MAEDFSNFSMAELFRVETENQASVLTKGLLELEGLMSDVRCPMSERLVVVGQVLEKLMRAAHSLKGAARIVNLTPAVRVAHAMEDCFVAAQKKLMVDGGKLMGGKETSTINAQLTTVFRKGEIDLLLRGVDLFVAMSRGECKGVEDATEGAELKEFHAAMGALLSVGNSDPPVGRETTRAEAELPHQQSALPGSSAASPLAPLTSDPASLPSVTTADRELRMRAENMNRLMGLAGEALVEWGWMRPFAERMQRLKRMQWEQERMMDGLKSKVQRLKSETGAEGLDNGLETLGAQLSEAREFVGERLEELEIYDRRAAQLSNRLYVEVLRARMRPFGDVTGGLPRLARDVAKRLGKRVRLEVVGERTPVDRDILDWLEGAMTHLVQNAVDHGCETAEERKAAGKASEAVVRVEARHRAGKLEIEVRDDGAGVDMEQVRRVVVEKKLATAEVASRFGEDELLAFLFLPGFTMKETVTEISGRGVGLDAVEKKVKEARGHVKVASAAGRGTRIMMQLPLTKSVMRALMVEVGGEPYAIPLGQIVRTLKLNQSPKTNVQSPIPGGYGFEPGTSESGLSTIEGRLQFRMGAEQVGLVRAEVVLGVENRRKDNALGPEMGTRGNGLEAEAGKNVVVLGEGKARYGLVVDKFLGERELVVQPLDVRLGKVKDISAAATMEDGSPVLILDVEDLVRSIEKLVASGAELEGKTRSPMPNVHPPESKAQSPGRGTRRKRVLAVDDSMTVRELERKLLMSRNYEAEVAVDGMEAWNMVRAGDYDLVITDVDMPRMDGIALTALIKGDERLRSLPVMIVSYKERAADRVRGLEAGADYYLTKGSFQDESWLAAVEDLIGEAEGE